MEGWNAGKLEGQEAAVKLAVSRAVGTKAASKIENESNQIHSVLIYCGSGFQPRLTRSENTY